MSTPVAFEQEPSLETLRHLPHVHVGGKCRKNREGQRCGRTMTREERTTLAVGMLDKFLAEHDGTAHEDKMEQTLSDLNYAIEHLEVMFKNLPDPLSGDDPTRVLVLEDESILEDLAEAVVGVRTDYGTLAQAWDNRA